MVGIFIRTQDALQEERPDLLALMRQNLLPVLVAAYVPLTVEQLVVITGSKESKVSLKRKSYSLVITGSKEVSFIPGIWLHMSLERHLMFSTLHEYKSAVIVQTCVLYVLPFYVQHCA